MVEQARPKPVPRAMQQEEWLHTRLAGTSPGDFDEAIRFCCTFDAAWPAPFAPVCTVFRHVPEQPPDVNAILGLGSTNPAQSLLIFSDPSDQDQVAALSALVTALDALGQEAPPMLWAPHTRRPELRTKEEAISAAVQSDIMKCGLDGVICSESTGLAFATTVAARFQSLVFLTASLTEQIAERRELRAEADMLEETIHTLLWVYLRVRYVQCIPALDHELEDDGKLCIQGYTFGHMLGKGAYGRVYKITNDATGATEVVKVVDKAAIRDGVALKCTKRMIEIMTRLSSNEWMHPNITRLHRVYHAPNQLLFVMEYGGPGNLYRRLMMRSKTGEEHQPLTCTQVHSMVHQILIVVSYLHTGPKVCHRDIKPENFIVSEDGEKIVLKITDFDLAIIPDEGGLCRSPCGTLPFTAPEVVLNAPYIGYAADMWSLGIVLLEVMCGVRIVERSMGLQLNDRAVGWEDPVAVATAVQEGCGNPGDARRILEANCRPEVVDLLPDVAPLVDGTITVHVPDRWSAEQLLSNWRHPPVEAL